MNLYGLCASVIPKLESKCLTAKYNTNPISSAFAISKIPLLEELPSSFSRYVAFRISVFIKAILSKAEYIELSIEEKSERKRSVIVNKIELVVGFKKSTSQLYEQFTIAC